MAWVRAVERHVCSLPQKGNAFFHEGSVWLCDTCQRYWMVKLWNGRYWQQITARKGRRIARRVTLRRGVV